MKAIVFHPERNEILLLRRKKNQRITFPGGQYDPHRDQTLQDTFDRELLEESSLRRKLNVPFSILGFHFFSPFDSCTTVARVIGVAQAESDDVALDEDHDQCMWIEPTLDKLGSLALENTTWNELLYLLNKDKTQMPEPVSPDGVILPLKMDLAA